MEKCPRRQEATSVHSPPHVTASDDDGDDDDDDYNDDDDVTTYLSPSPCGRWILVIDVERATWLSSGELVYRMLWHALGRLPTDDNTYGGQGLGRLERQDRQTSLEVSAALDNRAGCSRA